MKNKFSFNQFPYIPRLWSAIVYFILLIGVMLLFLGRKKNGFALLFPTDMLPEFYSHISNFVISFVICLVSGYTGILKTRNLRASLTIAALLILANFLYEWFIPVLNTPDKIDAYYGFAGSLLPFLFFYFYRKYGLKPNPKYKEQ